MANLRNIKDRINSIKNTQKITKAMKMVAAAKVKKAEKFDNKVKKLEYKRKIKQMDMDTMIKIRERKLKQKEAKKNAKNSKDGPTEGI